MPKLNVLFVGIKGGSISQNRTLSLGITTYLKLVRKKITKNAGWTGLKIIFFDQKPGFFFLAFYRWELLFKIEG